MPAVLLGNGFSRAFDNERFDYAALYEAARFPERLADVFDAVDTRDFETVLRRLDQFLLLLPAYGVGAEVRAEVRSDRTLVRRSLIQALRAHHPDGPWAIEDDEAERCATFLRQFRTIFTVNYDLLLYWVIVKHLTHVTDDGFRGMSTLTWQGRDAVGQNVYYVHGGLHLWEARTTVRKLRYEEGTTLIDQLSAELEAGNYPLFVSEGTSAQKRERIYTNEYLSTAYAALRANSEPLVVYGMRLGAPDRHIIDAIRASRTPELTITYWDRARASEVNRLRGVGNTLVASLQVKLGVALPFNLVPASTIFQWR